MSSATQPINLDGGEIAEVEEWIHEILAKNARNNHVKAEQLKAPLKSYLSQLVDTMQFEASEATRSEDELVVPDDFSLVEQVRRKLATAALDLSKKKQLKESIQTSKMQSLQDATRQETSYFGLTRSVDSFDVSRQEQAHFSEFGTSLHTYKFGQAKRDLDFATNRSPGPATYTPNTSALNSRPAIFFPKNTVARSDFLKPVKDLPGPTQYFPSKHFLSK